MTATLQGDPQVLYRKDEYTIRKGKTTITYWIADVSDFGCLLKPVRGGQPIGQGRWHAWKSMQWDFRPSSTKRPWSKAF